MKAWERGYRNTGWSCKIHSHNRDCVAEDRECKIVVIALSTCRIYVAHTQARIMLASLVGAGVTHRMLSYVKLQYLYTCVRNSRLLGALPYRSEPLLDFSFLYTFNNLIWLATEKVKK